MKLPKHEYNGGLDYTVGIEDGTAAAVSVLGWSSNSLGLSIEPLGPIVDGQPFVVAVKVRNATGHKLHSSPSISLGSSMADGGLTDGDDYEITPLDDETEGDALKRGAVMTQKFTVTPKNPGHKRITLAASATVWSDTIGPVQAGAMEARSFDVKAEPAPRSVAAK
jgi:hypothetical protein